ncbi:2-keto-4-pentenoate hydratase [Virgibacillus xinjiangensis]|uniref:2-keto-4-pentenoate hydratase n=1 Tax=Virgibacillus xinjiangensis TaxID=393090 RepID=A0ABV7CZ84_9BACI
MPVTIDDGVFSILDAEKTRKPIEPFTFSSRGISVDEAYQIQLGYVRERTEKGAAIVGKKIGLTSKAMQEMLGVDQPDYGHLLDDMIYENASLISISPFIKPRVEFEIAFILKKDLKGPGVTAENVMDATDYVVPAIEIIDSRIRDWKIKFEDTVSDNGSSAGAIFGEGTCSLDAIDLPNVEMKVYKNDKFLDEATGAAVMGNPVAAVAWLANAVGEYDISLKAGEKILAGALSKAVDIEGGETFKAEFSGLGTVTATFEK